MRVRLTLLLVAAAAAAGCKIERHPPVPTGATDTGATAAQPIGLRTVIYHVPDLAAAKTFYARLLGEAPYFDEPFYVGFEVGGYELGLDPDTTNVSPGAGGAVAYWMVDDIDAALARALELGATEDGAVQDVGDGVRTATVRDPFGNVIGLIDDPSFRAPDR